MLDFFDRHYNYQQLVKRIIAGETAEEEKVMRIFEWTCRNIREAPKGLPVIDDHVWYIIVRGYAISEQFSDVFTTLCNYAKFKAFYSWTYVKDNNTRIALSFVKLKTKWLIFDPQNKVYFKNKSERLASIEDISKGDWKAISLTETGKPYVNYSMYFINLTSYVKNGFSRSIIQTPLKRFLYQINAGLVGKSN